MTPDEQTPASAQLRQVSDPRTLRALTHPVRIALIEVLSLAGPMTATEAGERIGESATTCSFHLRQLAKYDFVEEAGGGKGRARPWKMTSIGMQFGSEEGDPAAAIASSELARMIRERQLARYRTWLDTRASFPMEWRRAADESEYVFYVTADELSALKREMLEFLLPRFRERLTDASLRPPGAAPVELLTISYPIALPSGDGAK